MPKARNGYTTIRLPDDIRERLKQQALNNHRSLSNMILVALDEWLTEQERRQAEPVQARFG
jgi:predicted transcriptional regulator